MDWLPILRRTTFGGNPKTEEKCLKSSPSVTIINPFALDNVGLKPRNEGDIIVFPVSKKREIEVSTICDASGWNWNVRGNSYIGFFAVGNGKEDRKTTIVIEQSVDFCRAFCGAIPSPIEDIQAQFNLSAVQDK